MARQPAGGLDAVDRTLIRALQGDGRTSYADLAGLVGLSAPAVRQRVQRLVDSGVLDIVAVTDPLALGLSTMALVGLRVGAGEVDADPRSVADAAAGHDAVVYVVRTAGSFDVFVEVVCADMDTLSAVVNDHLRLIPGVRDLEVFPYFGIHAHRFTWEVPG